jgi:hypothetical protein
VLFPGRQPCRGVEMMPQELSKQDAIARAYAPCSKRRGPSDGFEVWDNARLIVRHLASSADEAVNEAWASVQLAAARAWALIADGCEQRRLSGRLQGGFHGRALS